MQQNTIQFLSHFIDSSTPVYGGAKDVIILDKLKSIESGDTSNDHKITLPLHASTHIDFPYHFSATGKKCQEYPASFWVFENIGFIECEVGQIEKEIEHLPENIEMLILKTGFGNFRHEERYWAQQPVIEAKYADIFKSKFPKLRVFGFDMISLTSKLDRAEGKQAHLNFLIENDILILEDMHLVELYRCPSRVIISPLQISNVDGVPCTVIAILEDN